MKKGHYQFLEYRIDAQSRTLCRNAQPIYLAPTVFNTLLHLIENANRVVSKEELVHAMRPAGVARESTLVKNISAIRTMFADFNEDFMIQTVAKRGYKLSASVIDLSGISVRTNPQKLTLSVQQGKATNDRRFIRAEYPIVFALFAFLVASAFIGSARDVGPQYKYVRLTSNSEKLPVLNASISPDGKRVAYIETNRAYVSDIGSVERRELILPANVIATNIQWYPDNEHVLLNGFSTTARQSSAWRLSSVTGQSVVVGGLRSGAVLSSDGMRMASLGESSVWVSAVDMQSPKLVARFNNHMVIERILQFSGDGKYLLAACQNPQSNQMSVASINVATGVITQIYQSVNPTVGGVLLRSNVLLVSEAIQNGGRLLSMHVDLTNGGYTHLHVMNQWDQGYLRQLSVSNDERRITGVFDQSQPDIYVGTLHDNGNVLDSVQRLTLDDSNDVVAGWLADSQSVLFVSDRHNSFGIYRQGLNQRNPELLTSDQRDSCWPTVSTDNRSLFYFSTNPDRGAEGSRSILLRKSFVSGGAQVVDMTNDETRSMRCAAVAKACVIAEHSSGKAMYYQFDQAKGRMRVLLRTDWNQHNNVHDWDVAPNGGSIAYIDTVKANKAINVVSLNHQSTTEIQAPENTSFQTVYWDANGSGFYAAAIEHRADGRAVQLLHITLGGSSTLLRYLPDADDGWMISSADGKHLAIQERTANGNIMMLERS